MPLRTLRPVPVLATVGLLAGLLVGPLSGSAAAASCGDFSAPVLNRAQPRTGNALLTLRASEASSATQKYGYSADLGTAFRASPSSRGSLVAVHRLYSARTRAFLNTADSAERQRLVRDGYVDQGARFYVSATPGSCLVGIRRLVRGDVHRLLGTEEDAGPLLAQGWRDEGVKFYARPAAGDSGTPGLVKKPIATTTGTTFSFAAVPDTQLEVLQASDPRWTNRSTWLLKQPRMSFFLQTGDLVNWDTDDHAQWANAKRGLAPVEKAKMPYTFAVGNHDNMATGPGGSARDPKRTRELLRDTTTLNSYFDAADFRGVGGEFEEGKVDNVYTLYTAGGLKWMVLTLEFSPRASAIAWARRVVADHPDYNVIISTHYYLTKDGKIGTTNSGYGDTSPQYLWKQLVSQYPNIKFVFSGHTGLARKARVDTGVRGNKVYSFLTTMHDKKSNPTRVVTIDTKAGTLQTSVYGPYTKRTWSQYTQTIKGLQLVR